MQAMLDDVTEHSQRYHLGCKEARRTKKERGMSVATARKRPFVNVRDFMAFLESRPNEERWELINGVPMMMAPPKIRHQQIASNLELHLRVALRERKPEWRVYREIGLVMDESGHYRPEPEIAVVDAD